MIRAASDSLPTPLNLVHWRYWRDPKCPLRMYRFPTTKHVLNGCPKALSQDCYMMRHDSILWKLLVFLRQHLKDKGRLFGDLKGFRVMENSHSTVQIYIMPTSDWPDIVFVCKDNQITIIEFRVPFDSLDCINAANEYKSSKYQLLLSNLEAKNYSSQFIVIEISALGHYLNRTCESMNQAFPSISKGAIRNLLHEAEKTAITASQRIFMAQNEEIWSSLATTTPITYPLFMCVFIFTFLSSHCFF